MVEYENQGLRSLQEDPYVSWFHCTTEAFLISTLYTLWRDWNCSLLKKGVACHYTPSLLISMVAAFHPDTGGPPIDTHPPASPMQLQTEYPINTMHLSCPEGCTVKLLNNNQASGPVESFTRFLTETTRAVTSALTKILQTSIDKGQNTRGLEVSKYLTNI